MSPEHPPIDPAYMRQALALAGAHRPSPNPRVGAVIVKDGRVVGSGAHERAGQPHAEVLAIANAGAAARGADMYVTLEPCCHQGRTGPCTEAIKQAGLARVIIGMIDPDPRVRGRGARCLEQRGYSPSVGVLEEECRRMLEGYATHRLLGRPQVTLKAAITLDGAIAARGGDSRWISSSASRARAHALRAEADAVLVGVETVLADDPELTVRHVAGDDPLRVVLDSKLRTPTQSKLVATAARAPLLLAHAGAPPAAVARFAGFTGVETLACAATPDGRVDPRDLLRVLAERGMLSLLVEGGGRVHGALLAAGVADRFALFLAPKLLGPGVPWIALPPRDAVSAAIAVEELAAEPLGPDLLITGRLTEPPWRRAAG
jgi:diaminohydroxyphosphoribosylaminopyrimidine deaminase/5-amino-6-(5-phosphoribosylamino)uracil reductase